MKFKLLSDLHLEFEKQVTDFTPIPEQEDAETVLILAGDIGTGLDAEPFIRKMCKRFYKVVYILGNHEFYDKEFNKVRRQWAIRAVGPWNTPRQKMPDNFIFLDDGVVIIDDPYDSKAPKVRIIGGTLWTDMNDSNWFAIQRAKDGMNDYDCIKIKEGADNVGYRKRRLHPHDTIRAHNITKVFITETLRKKFDGPTIVVTHHLPHPLCIDPLFKTHPLNPAYVTNLDDIIADNEIAVWCHGHTHHNVDVEIHDTRILCNPRGYTPRGLNKGFDETLTFEL